MQSDCVFRGLQRLRVLLCVHSGGVIEKVEGSYVKFGLRWQQNFVCVPTDGEFSHLHQTEPSKCNTQKQTHHQQHIFN